MRAALTVVGFLSAASAGLGAWAQTAPTSETGGMAYAMEQRAKEVLQGCFECHGDGGISRLPTRPNIAGQNSEYVLRQLLSFRRAAEQQSIDDDQDADNQASGAGAKANPLLRTNPIMAHIVGGMDRPTIWYVAKALSQLSCRGETRDKATPVPNVPKAIGRCTMCHGLDGISRQAGAPNLAGQQVAYLRRQLLLIRETAYGAKPRENEEWRSHPIMEREAARISIEDVDALANYYAALDCRGPQ